MTADQMDREVTAFLDRHLPHAPEYKAWLLHLWQDFWQPAPLTDRCACTLDTICRASTGRIYKSLVSRGAHGAQPSPCPRCLIGLRSSGTLG
jgi:hypothetical protein